MFTLRETYRSYCSDGVGRSCSLLVNKRTPSFVLLAEDCRWIMKPKLGWPQNCFPRLCNWKPRLASKTIIFLQNIRNLSCPYKNEVYLQIKARKSFSHVKFFCVPEASSFFHSVEKNQSQAIRDWTILFINSLMTWLKNCFFLLMLAQYPYTIEEENFTWISRVLAG